MKSVEYLYTRAYMSHRLSEVLEAVLEALVLKQDQYQQTRVYKSQRVKNRGSPKSVSTAQLTGS